MLSSGTYVPIMLQGMYTGSLRTLLVILLKATFEPSFSEPIFLYILVNWHHKVDICNVAMVGQITIAGKL